MILYQVTKIKREDSTDPPGTIEMYITDQSSIISPSSEDTFLKTFKSEISSVMK